MIDTNTECDAVVTEFLKFSADLVYLGPAITDVRVEIFEKDIGFELPFDFKYLIKKHNGFSLSGTEVFGLDKKLRGSSMDEVYKYEHLEEIYNRMPDEFLPFSPDGRGNHYCLNLSKWNNKLCPVVFWQHDFKYQSLNDVEECNDSFVGWVKEVMIEWTLEDINYDGSEK